MISAYPPGVDALHLIIMFITWGSSEEEAKAALKPAEDSFPGEPVMKWFCQETSMEKEYAAQVHANPAGHRYFCENAYIHNDADVAKVIKKAMTTSPSKETYTFWYPLCPWSQRDLPDMALSMRTDHYLALYGIWKDEKDDSQAMDWAADIIKDVKKHSPGSYLGDIDFQVRTTKFWGDQQAQKLGAIRRRWDPRGIICGYLDAKDESGVNGLDNELDDA
jgi:hypothetical protein